MDKPTYKCDQMTQTDHTTIKPKPFARNLSNRSRTELEKQNINTYWPSDDNDSTDDELQNDPPEIHFDHNSQYKTYTYVQF